jgi:glutamyl/glutaminyl-tRNA synthetase
VNTRFRPTPYRDLHLGHIWTAWHNWSYAAEGGDEFILIADDIAYNLQHLHEQSWSVTKAIARFCEDLTWLGIPPTQVIFSTRNAEAHAEAAAVLNLSPPGIRADTSFRGPMVCTPEGAQMSMYHPWLVMTRVVDDALAGVEAFVRGSELVTEAELYDHFHRVLYGGLPPRQRYIPVVRREENAEKESKSLGSCSLRELREAGYTPREIIDTLRECDRRSRAADLRDTVIPAGVLEPEETRTLAFADSYRHRMATAWETRAQEPWGEDVMRMSERFATKGVAP